MDGGPGSQKDATQGCASSFMAKAVVRCVLLWKAGCATRLPDELWSRRAPYFGPHSLRLGFNHRLGGAALRALLLFHAAFSSSGQLVAPLIVLQAPKFVGIGFVLTLLDRTTFIQNSLMRSCVGVGLGASMFITSFL